MLRFARALRRARRARDLSQEVVATRAGLSPRHLSDIERAVKEPRLTTIVRLAQAIGIGVDELLADLPEPPERLHPVDHDANAERRALAQALRRARMARGLSQEQLAVRAGLSPKHIGELERANKDPRVTTVLRLAEALGISLADLEVEV